MEISSIFVNETSGEGIYAIKEENEDQDEFERNLDLWSDPEYVINYLETNKEYLQTEYFKNASIDDLALKIEKEALEIEKLMYELAEKGFDLALF